PDHQPADLVPLDQREQHRDVIAEAPAADRFERAGDHQPRVAEREADRLGADIEPHDAAPWGYRRAQLRRVAEKHDGSYPNGGVPARRLPMREDEVTDGNRRDEILGNAPQSARGFFAVPKVVE